MLRTRLCDNLGIAVPIILPPMGGSATSAEFVVAVANLGGLGVTERLGSAPETTLTRARFVAGSSARAKAPAPGHQ
jgi:NAD(P)H-dependent flavin oxidoreductase YrpB (nitropropane dioxygenase family)